MKKKFLLLVSTLVILCSCLLPAFAVDSKPSTEILHYELKIDPCSDYSLDVEYNLKFKVLSTDKEITWIKIPIQNSSVDKFEPISDNIDEIRYYEEDGKNYIRINLGKIYSENDIIEINFSVHQSDIHTINNDIIYYSYIIEGFSNMTTNELVVLWNSKHVLESSSTNINSNSYYIWNSTLESDKKFNLFVKYDLNKFEEIFEKQDSQEILNEDNSESDSDESDDGPEWNWSSFVIGIFVGVLLVLLAALILS